MHIFLRMEGMLDFICMGCEERVESGNNLKILEHSGTRTHNLEIRIQSIYRLSYLGFMKTLLLKWPLYI